MIWYVTVALTIALRCAPVEDRVSGLTCDCNDPQDSGCFHVACQHKSQCYLLLQEMKSEQSSRDGSAQSSSLGVDSCWPHLGEIMHQREREILLPGRRMVLELLLLDVTNTLSSFGVTARVPVMLCKAT